MRLRGRKYFVFDWLQFFITLVLAATMPAICTATTEQVAPVQSVPYTYAYMCRDGAICTQQQAVQSYCEYNFGAGAPTRIDNAYFDSAVCGCERTLFSCSTMSPPISTSWWRYPAPIDRSIIVCPSGYTPDSNRNACVLTTASAGCPAATPPYTYKPASGMCEREVPCLPPNIINQTGQCEPPETYTITLTPSESTIACHGIRCQPLLHWQPKLPTSTTSRRKAWK